MNTTAFAFAAIAFLSVAPLAQAEPIKIEAVLSQKEQSRMDFADGSKRYLAMVWREGKQPAKGRSSGRPRQNGVSTR